MLCTVPSNPINLTGPLQNVNKPILHPMQGGPHSLKPGKLSVIFSHSHKKMGEKFGEKWLNEKGRNQAEKQFCHSLDMQCLKRGVLDISGTETEKYH